MSWDRIVDYPCQQMYLVERMHFNLEISIENQPKTLRVGRLGKPCSVFRYSIHKYSEESIGIVALQFSISRRSLRDTVYFH